MASDRNFLWQGGIWIFIFAPKLGGYEESFSFDMSYDGKLCRYRYYSTDDMKDVCSVGNIPYFRVGDELDAYRYTDENVSEFWECARDLFNL